MDYNERISKLQDHMRQNKFTIEQMLEVLLFSFADELKYADYGLPQTGPSAKQSIQDLFQLQYEKGQGLA